MRSISARATERSPGRLRTFGSLVLAAGALAGCGDSGDGEGESGAEPVGQELGGSVAQLASCSDWNDATEAEKVATIEDVRSQVNQQDSGVESFALTDSETMEVFDNGCDRPEAQGFRLYLLYARAVTFKPLQDIAEGEVTAPSE